VVPSYAPLANHVLVRANATATSVASPPGTPTTDCRQTVDGKFGPRSFHFTRGQIDPISRAYREPE
jgi:hypothetical protein